MLSIRIKQAMLRIATFSTVRNLQTMKTFLVFWFFIDFKKVLNTVDWHYLFDCIKAFNFGLDSIGSKPFIATLRAV